jgi:hypothetical protein
MVHELGHAFGLPDATSNDGTPMSASLYDYPNTHFMWGLEHALVDPSRLAFLKQPWQAAYAGDRSYTATPACTPSHLAGKLWWLPTHVLVWFGPIAG